METNKMQKSLLVAVLLIILLGGALRIVGMTWGMPYQLIADETALFANAWERARSGEAITQSEYPPLHMIFLARERQALDFFLGEQDTQLIYFFFARYTSVLMSLLLLAVAYRLGKEIGGAIAGLGLMGFIALEPIVALEMGWLVKADTTAWMFALTSLWLTFRAQQARSWQWLAGGILFGLLATFAKYNMVFVFMASAYVGWSLLFGQRRAWILPVLLLVGLFASRVVMQALWVDTIAAAFDHCGPTDSLDCSLFLTVQKHAYPFYQNQDLWGDTQQATLEHIQLQFEAVFSNWRLWLGTLAIAFWILLAWRQDAERQKMWLVLNLLILSVAIFAFLGVDHPPRQYFFAMVLWVLAVLMSMSFFAQRRPQWMAGLLVLALLPYLPGNIADRFELRKTDSRTVTADYLWENVRTGDAIIVEYDHTELVQQYAAFPEEAWAGFLNIMPVRGIYPTEGIGDISELAERGVYYVLTDERGGGYGGYYSDPSRWPENFELILDVNGEDYTGPDRRLFRTFKPQYDTHLRFGNVATLHGYDLAVTDDGLEVMFYWQSEGENFPDYSLFLHVIEAETGDFVIGPDAPPNPATRWWTPNQWVFDRHTIMLDEVPAGVYLLRFGIYDPVTGERQPLAGNPSGFWDTEVFTVPPHIVPPTTPDSARRPPQ